MMELDERGVCIMDTIDRMVADRLDDDEKFNVSLADIRNCDDEVTKFNLGGQFGKPNIMNGKRFYDVSLAYIMGGYHWLTPPCPKYMWQQQLMYGE
jgi:hypothetical protein